MGREATVAVYTNQFRKILMINFAPSSQSSFSSPSNTPKRNIWILILVFAVGLVVGVGASSLAFNVGDGEEMTDASSAETNDVSEEMDEEGYSEVEEESDNYTPIPEDFEVDLTVTEQECFGSAGCNLALRVEPNYVGSKFPESGEFEITYEVTGIEDAPQIQTFTLDGAEFSFTPEIRVQTESESSEPRAEVTDVYEAY